MSDKVWWLTVAVVSKGGERTPKLEAVTAATVKIDARGHLLFYNEQDELVRICHTIYWLNVSEQVKQ